MVRKIRTKKFSLRRIKNIDQLLSMDDISDLLNEVASERPMIDGLVVVILRRDNVIGTWCSDNLDDYRAIGLLERAKLMYSNYGRDEV